MKDTAKVLTTLRDTRTKNTRRYKLRSRGAVGKSDLWHGYSERSSTNSEGDRSEAQGFPLDGENLEVGERFNITLLEKK